MRKATNTSRHDTTSTDTYELPDKTTVSISDCTSLPEATTSSMNKQQDETPLSLLLVKPIPDATSNQLPDVTVVQVISDETDNQNQMEFEATVEYPVSDRVSESIPVVVNTPVPTNSTNVTTLVGSDIAETEDNLLLENNLDLDLDQSSHADSEADVTNLKKCIIKLTDFSAEERNKWLGLTEKSSISNLSSDSNNSRYYMPARVTTTRNNKRPGRKTSKPVNYHESPPSRELNDSDYEPAAKREKPLDNKRYPSDTRIAMQKIINENKSANQGICATRVLLDKRRWKILMSSQHS